MAISRKKPFDCPIEATLAAVSARWKARIVWQLASAPQTFVELRSRVDGISDRMLTAQIFELVVDGIIESEHRGPGHPYRLTAAGNSLLPVLDAMRDWGSRLIDSRNTRNPARLQSPRSDHEGAADWSRCAD